MRKGKPVEPPPPQAYVQDLLRDCKQPLDVLDVFDQEQGAFDLVNCAAALRRFRQLQVSKAPHKRASIDKRRLAVLAAHSMTELEQQKLAPPPRTIAALAHSLTALGFTDTKFSLRVASMAAGQLHRFSSIDLAQLLGALSRGGRVERQRGTGVVARSPLYHGGLLQEASPRIARLANRMNDQTLAQLWLSLATVGHHDDVAVPALERELLRKRADLTHQGLCNAVHGAAKLGRNRSPLFSELAPALTKAAPKLAPVGLAQVLWAYTSTGNFDLPLIGALAKAARHPQRARAMSPQQLANVSTSLARTVLFAESVPYYAAQSAAVRLAGLEEEEADGGRHSAEATGAHDHDAGIQSVASQSSHGSAPVIAEDRSKVTSGRDLALELEVGGAPRREQLLRAKDLAGMSRSQLKMESGKRRQALIKSIRLEDAMKQFAGRAKALLGAWGEYESRLHAAKSSVRQEAELAQHPGNKAGPGRPTGHAPDTVGGALADDDDSMAPSQPGNKHGSEDEERERTMDAWGVVDTDGEGDDGAAAGVARAISESVRPASTGTAALTMEVERAREAVEAKGGVFHGVTGDMKDTGRGRGQYQQRAPQEMLPIDVTALASTFRKLGVKDDEFSGMVAEHMARHSMKYRATDLIKTAESLGWLTPPRHAAVAAAALASPKVASRLQKQTDARQLAAAVTVASGCLRPALLPALYARDCSSRTGKGAPLGFVHALNDPVAMAAAPKLRRFLRAAGDTLAKRSTELLPGSLAMAAAELALAGIDPGALLLRLARECSHKDLRSWAVAQRSALLAIGLHCIAVHESGSSNSADAEEVAHAARKIAGYALHQMKTGSMSPVDAALCALGAALATNPNGGATGGWIQPETALRLVEAAEERLLRETAVEGGIQRGDGADSSSIVKAVRKSGALPALGLARAMAVAVEAAGADRSPEALGDDASGGARRSEPDSRVLASIREAAARAAEASLTGWGALSMAPKPSPSVTRAPSTPAIEFLTAALAKTMPGSNWDQGVLRALQEASEGDSELADLLRGTEVATGGGEPAAGGAADNRVTVASVTRALRQLRERASHGGQHRCGIQAGVAEALGMLNGQEAGRGTAVALALEVWPPARLPSSGGDVGEPPEWVPGGASPAEEVATGSSSQSGGGRRAGESAGSTGGLRLWALADAWVRVRAGAGQEKSMAVPVVVATGTAPSGGGETGRLSPLDAWRVRILKRGVSGGMGGGVAVVREGEWRDAAKGGWTKEQQDILRSAPSAGTLRRVLRAARGEHAASPGEQQCSLVRHALHSAGIQL